MLIVRLSRIGRKRKPFYRIVVAEKRRHVKKKFLEALGTYDPISKEFKVKEDRVKYYVDLNIELSDTVRALFVKNNLVKETVKK